MLRHLAERMARRSVFKRRLPPTLGRGRFYVSASAGLRYLFRPTEAVDANLLGLAQEFIKHGHTVWDVGANVGLFSFSAAYLAGPGGLVYAFEPDGWLVQLLRRSASIQSESSSPVRVVPTAVGASCKLRQFNVAARSRSANALEGYGSTQMGGVRERQIVMSVSLDWLSGQLPSPDVLKIDVEGAELEVLSGAPNLLREKRPVIVCEVAADHAREVAALLKAYHYRLFDGGRPPEQRIESDFATWCTVAVPS